MRKACQEAISAGKGTQPLEELSREIHTALKVLFQMLQGKAVVSQAEGVSEVEGSQHSSSHVHTAEVSETSVVSRTSCGKHERVESLLTGRLKKIVFLLYGYRLKVSRFRAILESEPGLDIVKSPVYQTMLHFEWSADKQVCLVSALGVSLPNEYCYSDCSRPFVAVAQSDRALHSILQAVECGSNVLLLGHVVRQ